METAHKSLGHVHSLSMNTLLDSIRHHEVKSDAYLRYGGIFWVSVNKTLEFLFGIYNAVKCLNEPRTDNFKTLKNFDKINLLFELWNIAIILFKHFVNTL